MIYIVDNLDKVYVTRISVMFHSKNCTVPLKDQYCATKDQNCATQRPILCHSMISNVTLENQYWRSQGKAQCKTLKDQPLKVQHCVPQRVVSCPSYKCNTQRPVLNRSKTSTLSLNNQYFITQRKELYHSKTSTLYHSKTRTLSLKD